MQRNKKKPIKKTKISNDMIVTKSNGKAPIAVDSDGVLYYINEEGNIKNNIIMTGKNKLMIVPNIDAEREVIYCAGASGSGKSTMASKFITKYLELYPDNDFFLFSRKPEDKILDKLDPIRVPINKELIEDKIDITTEFKRSGSVLLFDDCNTISDKKLKEYVEELVADILEVGRAYRLTCIITNHLIIPSEKNFSRTILNELTSFVFFPKSGSVGQTEYCLSKHFGFNKKQTSKIMSIDNSRWICILRNYPPVCISEKLMFVI